jgi:hypothetical protein
MDMPKPTEEHKRLVASFAGRWIGEERIHPTPWEPEGGTARATIESRATCDGFCVVTDYVQERGGRVSYTGHGVTGFDPRHRRYLQHWSDSISGVPGEAKPGIWEGDTLTFHGAGPEGRVRYVYRFVTPDAYEFRIETSRDGNTWTLFLEAHYIRARGGKAQAAKPKRKPARKKAKKVAKKARKKKARK